MKRADLGRMATRRCGKDREEAEWKQIMEVGYESLQSNSYFLKKWKLKYPLLLFFIDNEIHF